LICKVCDWVNRWFGASYGPDCGRLWDMVDAWEREQSNEGDLWVQESDLNLDLIERASVIQATDPQAAFRIYLRAADAGSLWAIQMVAWHYDTGTCVVADFELAQEYYHRAICAGSWMATISYARLLAEHGYFAACERVLEDGMQSDFVPAYFWYARLRFNRSRSRASCSEIRPLLEYASDRGHPGVRLLLAALLLMGKYGLRQIPTGFRSFLECLKENDVEEAAGTGKSGSSPADRSPAAVDTERPGSARRAAAGRSQPVL
jgi:TPR repeat protein